MSSLKFRILTGASALIMSAAAAATANAQTNAAPGAIVISGGGSSLIAPYAREAGDCFGKTATGLYAKATPPTPVPYATFNFQGTPPQNCATQHTDPSVLINFLSTGSGSGLKAIYQHDIGPYGALPAGQDNSDPTAKNYPAPFYAFSETALGTTDVNVYNNGGNCAGGQQVAVVAPGATPGTASQDCSSPPKTITPVAQFSNPAEKYGPLVQFPVLITPVAVAYSNVYKRVRNADGSVTEYKFNTKYKRKLAGVDDPADGGGLRLDQATYCAIFNGQITNWNDTRLQVLNQVAHTVRTNGVDPVTGRPKVIVTRPFYTLKDDADPTPEASWSVPLQIVGRNDSSGTTSLFTRHLARVCGDTNLYTGTNVYVNATTTLPTALQGPVYSKANANTTPATGETLGKFTRADGSDGVAKYTGFTAQPGSNAGDSVDYTSGAGRLGYVGPDYVHGVTDDYKLVTASLKVLPNSGSTTNYIAPTAPATASAFKNIAPPQSNPTTGAYDATITTAGLRSDPSAWVNPADKNAPLAYPNFVNTYPIVGTTNFLGYTCYAGHDDSGKGVDRGTKINNFLNWYLSKPIVFTGAPTAKGILPSNGFAALPTAWKTAVKETFVTDTAGGTATGARLNLNLWVGPLGTLGSTVASTGKAKQILPENPTCAVSGVVGS